MRTYERYCNDIVNVENYEKAKVVNFKGWQLHHRLETHNSDGERRLVDLAREELVALGMYYNRPANELIFMTIKEHTSLHMKGKKRTFSEEHKRHLSEACKGKYKSEEARRNMSEAHKGEQGYWQGKHMSAEHKKKLSEAKKNKHWRVVDGKRVWY